MRCMHYRGPVSGQNKARSALVMLDTDIHCFRVRATETS
jgi:hypothetical protein